MSVTFSVADSADGRSSIPHDAVEEVEVNVSNLNAGLLLDMLGVERGADLCGAMPARDFLGRVLVALAVAAGNDRVSRTLDDPGSAMVDCGRPTGYVLDRLTQLHELARFADRWGRHIAWA